MLALTVVAIACREEDPLTGLAAAPSQALAIGDPQHELQKLLAGDVAEGDFFGFAVAVEGNTALVGAEFDDDNGEDAGAVYVFTRAGGVWTEQQKLTPKDGSAGDFFGFSVAMHGSIAVIGAWGDDDNGSNSGSAYVFRRTAGEWTERQKLTAGDGEAFDQFGQAVDVSGPAVAIGAIGTDGDGAVYVYRRIVGGWTEHQKLTDGDGAAADQFGVSVAVDGATMLIGAVLDDDNGLNAGAAYVFTRSGGVWSEQEKLTASDGASGDGFGGDVALDGNTALVAAALDDDNGESSGSVYAFTRSAGLWSEEQKLLAGDGAPGDQFGDGIALDGNTAVVGAFQDDDNGAESGSAHVWFRTAGTWAEDRKLLASDGAAGDFFGRPVALDGNTAVIGAYFADHNGDASGSAYVFKVGRACLQRPCPPVITSASR
jgi:hypothetical protein